MARFRHDNKPRDKTNFSVYVHVAPNNKLYFGITSQSVESRWQHDTEHTEETKKKISDSCKGRKLSQETREKLRQKSLEYWKRKRELKGELENAI